MGLLSFTRHAVTSPKTTGAIAPSSTTLGKLMVQAGRVSEASSIVEFGPGTGALTRSILEALQPDAQFLAIEINEHFVSLLRKRLSGVTIIHDTAENTLIHLKRLGLDGCECIISGLPWTCFDAQLQDNLLNAAQEALLPGGRFVTFAYCFSPLMKAGKRFREKLCDKFYKVEKTPMAWKNVPPAFAYCAIKAPQPEQSSSNAEEKIFARDEKITA